MTAGEAENPRRTMPRAFNSVFYRLTTFFVGGSLCVGIVVSYSDPLLLGAISDARPGAGSSPYVIAMERLQIPVLPHIVNALVMTSIFSAGNSYVFCASRTLFGLALEGKVPRFLARCTNTGVPIYCVGVTLAISMLSFLQVSNNAAVVFQWYVCSGPRTQQEQRGNNRVHYRFVNLVTASQLLNYAIISFTYIRFHNVSSYILTFSFLFTHALFTGIEESRHLTRIFASLQLMATVLWVRSRSPVKIALFVLQY